MATAREPQSKFDEDSVETIRRRLPKITNAYLWGMIHDATERKTTFRIGQKSKTFVSLLAEGILRRGKKAWVYQEGRKRQLWIVEFSKFWLKKKGNSQKEKIDYIRGYFDAEGGIAKSKRVRFYLYFAQKNRNDLEEVRNFLEEIGISCGKVHNPSKKVDPDYWRFYIRAGSYVDFARKIGSFHPEKSYFLRQMR